MDTQALTIDPETARQLWREYRLHQHYSEPIDREVMAAYKLLAQKKLVIKALESIVKAGLNEEGLPKLAILRADKKTVITTMYNGGGCVMFAEKSTSSYAASSLRFHWPDKTFPVVKQKWNAKAMAPIIPLMHRPKRGLQNYHVLWEAEWTPIPPVDPMLLRRIGKADMWCVMAAWDLTPVERAAMAGRL